MRSVVSLRRCHSRVRFPDMGESGRFCSPNHPALGSFAHRTLKSLYRADDDGRCESHSTHHWHATRDGASAPPCSRWTLGSTAWCNLSRGRSFATHRPDHVVSGAAAVAHRRLAARQRRCTTVLARKGADVCASAPCRNQSRRSHRHRRHRHISRRSARSHRVTHTGGSRRKRTQISRLGDEGRTQPRADRPSQHHCFSTDRRCRTTAPRGTRTWHDRPNG